MPNFSRKAIIPSGAMTGTATIASQAINMENFGGGSFQPAWTGDPTGTFTVWVSNDFASSPALTNWLDPMSVGTWSNLGVSIPANPAGSAGNTYIPIYASCSYYMILQYVNASGDGVLGGFFAGKFNG